MAGVDQTDQLCHWQLTDPGSPGFVRRGAAYWRCCDLTVPASCFHTVDQEIGMSMTGIRVQPS